MPLELSDEEWFKHQLGFNRSVLRDSRQCLKKDFDGVNPRELMRKIRGRIQDIDGKFKFETKKDPIDMRKEKVGLHSGFVRGGLLALNKHSMREGGIISYNPNKMLGVVFLTLGFIWFVFFVSVTLPQLSALSQFERFLTLFAGIALSITGVYFTFSNSEIQTFPIDITSRVRVLLLGEIWEKGLIENGSRETKMVGKISAVFSGDTHFELHSLENYRSTLRGEVGNVNALVKEIGKLKTKVLREICLENEDNMKEPLDPQKIMRMNWSTLTENLENGFGRDQVVSWISKKLVKNGVASGASISSLKEELSILKNEVQQLAKDMENYACMHAV